METTEYIIDKDIKVLCVRASSFPNGVKAAHQKLHSIFSSSEPRTFYGISHSDKSGNILYWAAAEELHKGEGERLNLETFTIRKGKYISELLEDWCKDEGLVGKTFKKLLADPRIDKNGYCLEVYLNEKDMRCMVPLDPAYSLSTKEKNTLTD
ncbi:MAG: transcriptional regulator [Bacteroidetes bacterium]|nr:MAG: transcriptional regulator [Bacteroidota bacterium]